MSGVTGPYWVVRKERFDRMLDDATKRNPVLRRRIEKRIRKLEQNPEHHGYRGKGAAHGHWVFPCTDKLAIIGDIDLRGRIVICLVLRDLDDL